MSDGGLTNANLSSYFVFPPGLVSAELRSVLQGLGQGAARGLREEEGGGRPHDGAQAQDQQRQNGRVASLGSSHQKKYMIICLAGSTGTLVLGN